MYGSKTAKMWKYSRYIVEITICLDRLLTKWLWGWKPVTIFCKISQFSRTNNITAENHPSTKYLLKFEKQSVQSPKLSRLNSDRQCQLASMKCYSDKVNVKFYTKVCSSMLRIFFRVRNIDRKFLQVNIKWEVLIRKYS